MEDKLYELISGMQDCMARQDDKIRYLHKGIGLAMCIALGALALAGGSIILVIKLRIPI